jgi:hypothetical protein
MAAFGGLKMSPGKIEPRMDTFNSLLMHGSAHLLLEVGALELYN